MAGDSRLFQEALKRGSSFAWNEQWDRAAAEYRLALEQFPEDVAAKNHLAMALYRAGHLSESLELYQSLWKSQPANMGVLQRMTELQELLGDKESAAAGYRVLAELQTRRGAHGQALQSWRKVVELKPDSLFFWNSLMDSAVQVGAVASVLPGYLNAARDVALQGRFDDALRVAERAQALDPANPAVLSLLSGIRRALEHSWRAASLGKQPLPDELAALIPPLRFEPHMAPRSRPQAPPRRPEPPARPAIPAYIPPPRIVPEPAPTAEPQPIPEMEAKAPVSPPQERPAPTPEPPVVTGEESLTVAAAPGVEEDAGTAPSEAAPEIARPIEVREEPPVEPAVEQDQEETHAAAEAPETEEPAPAVAADLETAAEMAEPSANEEEAPEGAGGAGLVDPVVDALDEELEEPVDEESPEAEPAAVEVEEEPAAGVEESLEADAVKEGPEAEPVVLAGLVQDEEVEEEPAGEVVAEPEPAPKEVLDPEAVAATPAEEQVGAEVAPRQQKGWLSRLAGFLWQPGDEASRVEDALPPATDVIEQLPAEDLEEPAGEEGQEAATAESPVGDEPDLEPEVAVDELDLAVSAVSEDDSEAATQPEELPSPEPDEMPAVSAGEQPVAAEPDEETVAVAPPAGLPAEVGYGVEAEIEAERAQVAGVDLDAGETVEVQTSAGATQEAEEVSDPQVAELLRQVQEVRESGRLEEAAEMLEDSISNGTSVPLQLTELAEIYIQLGQVEQAIGAYQQALESAPQLPRALIGMARLQFASEDLEAAQDSAQRAVRASAPESSGIAVDLLLEILRERAAQDQPGPVAETLSWLLSNVDVTGLPQAVSESMLAAPVELFGRAVGEHLAEVAALPSEVRGGTMASLMRAEEQLRLGSLRSAADEMYSVIASMPDFLPAQSLLGRILVAQGRIDDARERAERLVRLYELRGEKPHALEVLWWAVAQGMVNGEAKSQLVEMLRSQGRVEEAASVDLGWGEPASNPRGGSSRPASSRSVSGGAPAVTAERAELQPLPSAAELALLPLDELIRLAEERIAKGDRPTARRLVQVAIEGEKVDEAHRAALLRILQLTDPDGGERERLVEILKRLGLPLELADY